MSTLRLSSINWEARSAAGVGFGASGGSYIQCLGLFRSVFSPQFATVSLEEQRR